MLNSSPYCHEVTHLCQQLNKTNQQEDVVVKMPSLAAVNGEKGMESLSVRRTDGQVTGHGFKMSLKHFGLK